MKCPLCRTETEWQNNPYRPFCSERCKMIDLDHWLSERYRIPGGDAAKESEESTAAPGSEEEFV